MKRLLSLLFIAALAGTAQAGEIRLTMNQNSHQGGFGKAFRLSAVCTGLGAGLMAGSAWVYKQPNEHWAMKAAAGAAFVTAGYMTADIAFSSIKTLYKNPEKYDLLLSPARSGERQQLLKQTANKIKVQRLMGNRELDDVLRHLDTVDTEQVRQDLGHLNLRLAEQIIQKMAQRTETVFNQQAQSRQSLQSARAENPTQEDYVYAINELQNKKADAAFKLFHSKKQAWGTLTGVVTAIAGIAAVCYKTGWLSSLWK